MPILAKKKKKISFSDEAHFDLGGDVNKQNRRIWGTEKRETVIVNGDRYRVMLNEFLLTKIEEGDIDNIWFQQDASTCYTAEPTLDILRAVFEDRIIIRRADVVLPPQARDN